MRLTHLSHVICTHQSSPTLTFTGPRGELFQLTVLNHDLLRIQHFPDGQSRLDRTWMVVDQSGDVPREGRPRADLSPFPLPVFDVLNNEQNIRLQTSQLQVEINLNPLFLRWSDVTGREFAADLPTRAYAYDRAGRAVFHQMCRRDDEHYYGFGERSGPLDKRGQRMRMLNLDALGYNAETGDPLYKHFPFYITFVPSLDIAYGLFYDNLAATTFDMGQEIDAYHGLFRTYQADDGDLDCYLIYGPTIREVVEKFSALTGRMILPPRWSLGYLGSTMSYTEAPDAQVQLQQFVELCQQHDIPCDMFHLSSGYTTGADNKRYVFNWNHSRVPDPHQMVENFHRAGIRLAANIKPCLLTTHPRYHEVKAQGGFIRSADQDEPEMSIFWGGIGSYIDFTNPTGYAWWKTGVRESLLAYGIDATWNDNNEFEIWDDAARCNGFGDPLPISLLRPIQTLLMNRASYEAQRESRPDERPYLLSRSGCPGIQRYAQTWSGDNFTSWNTLRYNIPMGLGLSLSGAPNTGHDVGGFAGPRPDPELFVRWVQNMIFQPRFCIHSWNTEGTANEPWMYPDMLPLVREAIQFRYRLIPYLYSLFVEAARTGHPIIRPMVYEFPHDACCHTESFDFMLGPNLLVASVLEAGMRTRSVYLPAGIGWYDFYSGRHYEGRQTVEVDTPLERIPLFVPDGGIIPMGTAEVYVYPHPGTGRREFTLMEDDGISLGYQRGEYNTIQLLIESEPEQIKLDARYLYRGYTGAYCKLAFVLPPDEHRSVQGGVRTMDRQGRTIFLLQLA